MTITQFVLFCDTQFETLERTLPSMLTRMSFHSATISTVFKDYNSFLMHQNSRFNVTITNKIPRFIGFMKLACRFGLSKEKMDLHASLYHQEHCQYQKYLLKLSADYQFSKGSIFEFQAFWRHYSILKVQNIFKFDQEEKFGVGTRV